MDSTSVLSIRNIINMFIQREVNTVFSNRLTTSYRTYEKADETHTSNQIWLISFYSPTICTTTKYNK